MLKNTGSLSLETFLPNTNIYHFVGAAISAAFYIPFIFYKTEKAIKLSNSKKRKRENLAGDAKW
jgi:hypothetical protein